MKTQKTLKTTLILLSILILISISLNSASAAITSNNSTIYVSTQGNDSYDGLSPEYNATTGSGPKSAIKNATGTVAENGTIYIANGTYNESRIYIDKNMNIIGENQDNTIINGQKSGYSIFTIASGVTVTITNLTLTNGTAEEYGGAIYNSGNLNVNNSTFTNSTANYNGGAIYNEGNLTLGNSTFTGNTANAGGAITNVDGTLTVGNSTFTGNTAPHGGAITNVDGTLTVGNSTFTGNTASDAGGAIYNFTGTLTVGNSTFTGNTATGDGGTIYTCEGSSTVRNSTFTGNTAPHGGAIANWGTNVSVSFCRILDNGTNEIYSQGSVDAKYNWWGSNDDPSSKVSGGVDVSPWLVLTVTNDNSTILVGGNSTVTADLQHDSNNKYHDPKTEGHVPDGIPVTFNLSDTSLGSLSTTSATLTNGTAVTNFTATNTGTENVTATVDNQNNSTLIAINKLNTTLVVGNVTVKDGQTATVNATLRDENGHPLNGQEISFTVNGTTQKKTTNSEGVATLNYTPTNAGSYTVTASYNGSVDYLTSIVNGTLTVDPVSYLYVNVTTSNNNLHPGDEFVVKYKLSNSGPDSASNVKLTFKIPEGLEFVSTSVDTGNWAYDPTTRTVTWTLDTVPVGDPYLNITLKALTTGDYTITPTISTTTYNKNTNTPTPLEINIQTPNNNNNNITPNNNEISSTGANNTQNNTIPMQKTGTPLTELILAMLAVLGGTLIPRRKH